jgi:serine/threonine protein kinase
MTTHPSDNESTQLRTTPSPRPEGVTLSSAPADDDTQALPAGLRFNELEILEKIGEGGFSIVYLAWDHSLQRQVALKEYMPSSLAVRKAALQISPRSERHRDTFDAGLKSFINEARLLAQFDHPSLVKVYRFWEANGTAYMVMPFYKGVTLRDTLRARPDAPDEAWLLDLLDPLTVALQVIHAQQCYHRDIAPDNVILLEPTGRPLLLDFGAARRVIGDRTQALTVILKPGYAPVEQYAEMPDMKQGAWTDVYALGAVLYTAITRETPPASVGRLLSDNYVPLMQRAAGRYSASFLQAIDRALCVRPEQRTQNIAAFRLELGLDVVQLDAVGSFRAAPPDTQATVIRPVPAPDHKVNQPSSRRVEALPGESKPAASKLVTSNPRRLAMGGALAAALVSGAAWWGWAALRPTSVTPVTPTVAQPGAAQPAASAPVVAQLVTPAPRAAVDPKPDATPAPKSPVEALAQVMDKRDPTLLVTAQSARAMAQTSALALQGKTAQMLQTASNARPTAAALMSGQDALSVFSSEAGYVYVFGAQIGSDELVLLSPRAQESAQRVRAAEPQSLPRNLWDSSVLLAGAWRLVVTVVKEPVRDLQAQGWQVRGRQLHRVFNAASPSVAAQIGRIEGANCQTGSVFCFSGYGADAFDLSVTPEIIQPVAPLKSPVVPRKPPAKVDAAKSDAAKADAPPAQTVKKSNAVNPECATLLQRMSLGEDAAALGSRYKSLGCR